MISMNLMDVTLVAIVENEHAQLNGTGPEYWWDRYVFTMKDGSMLELTAHHAAPKEVDGETGDASAYNGA